MTIAGTEKEIRGIIDQHSVYGAETVINGLVRSCIGKQYLGEDELIKMIKFAFKQGQTMAKGVQ